MKVLFGPVGGLGLGIGTGVSPTCAESHPDNRQINSLAKKLALHFWCGVKIRRCVRELASVARPGAFALAGRYRDD
jgi:hypothetical protein